MTIDQQLDKQLEELLTMYTMGAISGYHAEEPGVFDRANKHCLDATKRIKQLITQIKNQAVDTSKVNRVEVIDHWHKDTGREYVFWEKSADVKLDFQDNGRTLKVFIAKSTNNLTKGKS